MSDRIGAKTKQTINIVLALVLIVGILIPYGSIRIDPAFAESGDATLSVGRQIMYAGYSTGYFEVNNYGVPAYCGNPSLKTPAPGNYTSVDLYINGGDNGSSIDQLAKIIYYGWGGPGFDASLYPSTWYDGSAMTNDNYHALTHILISQYFADDASAALKGTKQAFKDWYYNNIAPYVPTEGTGSWDANPSSTAWAITSMSIPEGFVDQCFVIQTGSSTQAIVGYNPTSAPSAGDAGIEKISTYPEMTQGNNMYSLAGAVFQLSDEDSTTLTTDSDGHASASGVKPGTYSLHETKAPKGFALNTESYSVTVTNGSTSSVTIPDEPQHDPTGAAVQKIDEPSHLALPEGDATLQGAEFTVKYYDNPNGDVSGTPLKTYVYATDEDGVLYFHSSYQVGGDTMYTMDGGTVLPLGSYSVQETKAPVGYVLPDPAPIHVATLLPNGTEPTSAEWTYLDNWNSVEYNAGVVPDKVQQGDFRLVKEVSTDVNNENPNGVAPTWPDNTRILVPGIKFQIINDSEHHVMSPETGKLVDPGEVVCTITTDENGLASTQNYAVNGWSLPSGFTAALAYGTYVIHEIIPDNVNAKFKAQYGFDVPRVNDWKTTIRSELQYDAPMLVNDKAQTPLKIVKQDVETGKQIPRVAGFQLFKDGKQVTYTYHYPDTQVIDTFYTNERGEVTLPMFLNPGDYTIVEVQAPEGYAINKTPIPLHVDSSFSTWDHPAVVTAKDMPIKGKIKVVKYDSQDTTKFVSHADYTVKAAEDIVTPEGTIRNHKGDRVAILTTNDKGEALTDELYLGKYIVYETKSPEGYALDTKEHSVVIESQGQDIPVVEVGKDLYDAPTQLIINKTNASTHEPLSGATFRIWQDGADEVRSYNTDAISDAIKDAFASESVSIDHESALIENIKLAKAGDTLGFVANVVKDGKVKAYELSLTLQDDFSMLATYSNETEAHARGDIATIPAKVVKNENAYDETFVTDSEGKINLAYIKHGAYHLQEVSAPEGYYLPEDNKPIDFTVDDQGFIGIAGKPFKSTLTLDIENSPNEIHTTATVDNNHFADAAEKIELVDRVTYSGAKIGKEYTVTGVLHIAGKNEDGTAKDEGVLTDKDNNPITATASFVAEKQEGSVDVTFVFDATNIAGKSVVAFEEMREGERLFATHADINDKDQSVYINPVIHTSLTDKATGNHTASVTDGKVELVDTVTYIGLTPGVEHTMHGYLHDASTGLMFKDANGKEVEATTEFTPVAANGTVDVTFSFSVDNMAGKSLVAFEEAQTADGVVATHADIEDKGQTVEFVSLGTTATNKADGSHVVAPSEKITLVDKVSYTGLTPGQEYTVFGTLMDKGSKKELLIDNKTVTSSATFTPDEANGEVEVEFTFDAQNLSGAQTVVFERMYQTKDGDVAGGVLVGSHEDIEDDGQTVAIETPGSTTTTQSGGTPTKFYDKTGDWLYDHILLIVVLIGALGSGAYLVRKSIVARRAKQTQNPQDAA